MNTIVRKITLICVLFLCVAAGFSQASRQLVMEEDVQTKPELHFYESNYGGTWKQPWIEWSPNDKLLGTYLYNNYGCPMSSACIWNVENGKQIKSLNNDEFFVWNSDGSYSIVKANPNILSYSPNRHYGLKGSDDDYHKYIVWNILTDSKICEVNTSSFIDVQWSKDSSKMFYLNDKNEICVLDVSTKKIIKTISVEGKLCGKQFAMSPKDTYMVLYYQADYQTEYQINANLEIINIETESPIASFEDVNANGVYAFSDDEKYVCFQIDSRDNMFFQLDLTNLKTEKIDLNKYGGMFHISFLNYSPDNKYLIIADGTIEEMPSYSFFDIEKKKSTSVERPYGEGKWVEGVGRLEFSLDGKKIAGIYYSSGIIFIGNYEPKDMPQPPVSNITILGPDFFSISSEIAGYHPKKITNDGKFVACDWGGIPKYLNIQIGEIHAPFHFNNSEIWIWSDEYVATIMDSEILIWDFVEKKEYWRITDNEIDEDDTVYHFNWSPDGRYFSYTLNNRNKLKVCDVKNRIVLFEFSRNEFSLYDFAYPRWPTNDCLYLGTSKNNGEDNNVFAIISSGKILELPETYYWDYYNNKRNNRFVAFTDSEKKEVRFYDLKTGKKLDLSIFDEKFSWGEGYFKADVCFTPNERYVVIVNSDNTAFKIFDMESLKELYYYHSPAERIFIDHENITNDFFAYEQNSDYFLFDIQKKKSTKQPCKPVFSPNGSYAAYSKWKGEVQIVDLNNGHTQSIEFGKEIFGEESLKFEWSSNLKWSSNSKCICYTNNLGFRVSYDIKTNIEKWYYFNYELRNSESLHVIEQKILPILDKTGYEIVLVSSNGLGVASDDANMQIYDIKTGSLLCTTVACPDGEYLTYTPEGFFTGTDWACHNLVYIVDGLEVTELTQLYDKLYRPDLIAAKMRGEDISEEAVKINLAALLNTGKPPIVTFANIPKESSERNLKLELRVKDEGGGIGAVSVVLNGQVVKLSDGMVSSKGQTKIIRHTVTLQPGENKMQAFAYNSEGVIESLRSETSVTWQGKTEKPNLYVLTVGVNKYRDKALWLNYAVPDAESIGLEFQGQTSKLYGNVYVKSLLNADVTKEGISGAFKELSTRITADDVFVFYVAGHGTTYDDGDYYYLPVNFRYTNKEDIPKNGVSKNDLVENLSLIKASKTLVMLDTCNSGAFLQNPDSRGMSEKTAIDRLNRATGHATLAASSDTESAMEGYNGHGIFTYVLLEGLGGNADSNGDGYITLTELANYVENEVPERCYEKFGYEQIPQKELRRQDFPLAGVE